MVTVVPCPGAAHHGQRSAGIARALGHAVEAEAVLAWSARRWVEADAVVTNREDELLGVGAELDVHMLGMAVPRGVRERLLADAQERHLGGGREGRMRWHRASLEPGGDAGALLPGLDLMADRGDEAGRRKRRRTKVPDRAPRFLERSASELASLLHGRLRAPFRSAIQQRVGGFELEDDAGQLLCERVVDLAGEAGALLEHRMVGERLHRQVHPPRQQRRRDERERRRAGSRTGSTVTGKRRWTLSLTPRVSELRFGSSVLTGTGLRTIQWRAVDGDVKTSVLTLFKLVVNGAGGVVPVDSMRRSEELSLGCGLESAGPDELVGKSACALGELYSTVPDALITTGSMLAGAPATSA